jgi:hypothetical protein
VFVLTHQAREPWVRPGGTTFFFVSPSIVGAKFALTKLNK